MSTFGEARDCRIMRNVKVPMRDGVRLATTVYLPAAEGRYPAVLVRTAYNRVGIQSPFLLGRGIAVVAQDTRGRYDSEGSFYPFVDEENDGFDTLEWLSGQPWCNGKIGMFGDSYLAATQFYAATGGACRFLTALNPRFMTGDGWKRAYYCDGALSLALTWSWLCFETNARTSEAGMMPAFDVPRLLRHRPLLTLDEASGSGAPVPHYRAYVRQSTACDAWRRLSLRDKVDRFTVPVLLTGGWYDYYAAETFANFLGLREAAATAALRDSHRLIVGPWTHGFNPNTTLGELDFGPAAHAEDSSTDRWLDCLLHGGAASDFQAAPIRLFVMGVNRWRDEFEWPLARTQVTPYYLRSGGGLSRQAPGRDEPASFTYDPADPVPTLGGNHSVGPYNPGLYEFCKPGPYDQRPTESRSDVLVFTSEVLPADLEVTGPVQVILHAASSAPDTDFVARLTDVYPDGRSINITEGVLRARFRRGIDEQPVLLEPGKPEEFRIDLGATSNVFKRGHRLRVQVTSSNFPLWDPNPNTGGELATETRMQRAQQTVFLDLERPSRILLPVIPSEET